MPPRILAAPPPPSVSRRMVSDGAQDDMLNGPSAQDDLPSSSKSRMNGMKAHLNGWTGEDNVATTSSGMNGPAQVFSWDDEVDSQEDQVILHIEARQNPHAFVSSSAIKPALRNYIEDNFYDLPVNTELKGWEQSDILRRTLDRVWVAEASAGTLIVVAKARLEIHVYRTSSNSGVEEFTATTEDDDDSNEHVPAASVRELPAAELDGLWDNLIYSDDIKPRLLNYIYATTLFSEAEVDFNVITWNRMVLLHGPPGTGKTSLCRALAQKLAVRLCDRYSQGKLVEINSHSLFSKWFSESGKLVQKLFSTVTEMVEEPDGFVVVMIDEVESLTAARAAAMSGNEPSDAVRVVNALLTQLDKLKTKKNVLVMTTSNIAGAIDSAFVDRADIKEFIGYPPPEAIYMILTSCLRELMKRKLIRECEFLSWIATEHARRRPAMDLETAASVRLFELSRSCYEYNLAGRFLRRIPVLGQARYLVPEVQLGEVKTLSMGRWITALERVVEDEKRSKDLIADAEGKRGAGTGGVKTKVDGVDHAQAS